MQFNDMVQQKTDIYPKPFFIFGYLKTNISAKHYTSILNQHITFSRLTYARK